jgi:hypothetical protein
MKPGEDTMTARQDENVIRLTLVRAEIARRGDDGFLPRDLQGDAIPNQISEHERALEARQSTRSTAAGEKEKAAAAYAETGRLLTTLRHALLAAYRSRRDARLAAFGPLGATQKARENLVRLEALAPKVAAAIEHGELVLPADLQPAALTAQAALHAALAKSKADKAATRQVGGAALRAERAQTRVMLRRLKSFVKAHYGDAELASFGFSLPLPPRHPRLPAEPTAPAPGPAAPPA